MEGLEGRGRIALQTRELVTPAKDTNWQEFAGPEATDGLPQRPFVVRDVIK